MVLPPTEMKTDTELATFAGGCFWCMEPVYKKLDGVIQVISGYTGGTTKNPTYEQVCSGTTGHYEAIQITFDPNKIAYQDLLDIFWHQIDPTDPEGQFVDRGSQYQTAVFYHNEKQKQIAEVSITALNRSGRYPKPIVTQVIPATAFYPAEEYHQDFYTKSPLHYQSYRYHSGRDTYLNQVWGKKNTAKK
ncbi:MAG: peptide-methionine (S)-S-oxide reductase MsrA [bacterium]